MTVFEIKRNSDKAYAKMSIPIAEIIVPIFGDDGVLTHFEINTMLAKLAYMRDYRSVDTIREATRTITLLNRVLLHDRTLVIKNFDSENDSHAIVHKVVTNNEVQTDFNDVIRNFFKRNILDTKSYIDSILRADLHEQYKDSNDEDVLFLEFNNIKISSESEE